MTINTSATGGYLAPAVDAPPTEGDAFEDQLHDLVAGITGIQGELVTPRWQPNDPKQPDRNVDWCAFGIVSVTPDANAYVTHKSERTSFFLARQPWLEETGHDEMQRHETVETLVSFYGPLSYGYAARLRDGFAIAQNREAMQLAGMGFVETTPVRTMSELVNQSWLRRVDIGFTLRRIILRTYPVLNIIRASGAIASDRPDTADYATLPISPTDKTPFMVEP